MTTATVKKSNGSSNEPKLEAKKHEPVSENAVLSLEKRIQKVEELSIVIEKMLPGRSSRPVTTS